MNGGIYKNLALWLVIALMMVLVFNLFNTNAQINEKITYSEFLDSVADSEVKKVTIKENKITGEYADNHTRFETYAPSDVNLIKELRDSNVDITATPPDTTPWYLQLLISWLPIILLIAIWIFFMRQMQGGRGSKAFSYHRDYNDVLSDLNINHAEWLNPTNGKISTDSFCDLYEKALKDGAYIVDELETICQSGSIHRDDVFSIVPDISSVHGLSCEEPFELKYTKRTNSR